MATTDPEIEEAERYETETCADCPFRVTLPRYGDRGGPWESHCEAPTKAARDIGNAGVPPADCPLRAAPVLVALSSGSVRRGQ